MIQSSPQMQQDKTKNNQVILEKVLKRVAPSWPLRDSVAVNPFFGFADQPFQDTAELMHELNNIQLFMSLNEYRSIFARNQITFRDIQTVLSERQNSTFDLDTVLLELHSEEENTLKVQDNFDTILRLQEGNMNLKLQDFFIEYLSSWASHFVKNEPNSASLFENWKKHASVDRSPSIFGIKNFQQTISQLNAKADQTSHFIYEALNLNEEQLEYYLLKLTYQIPGWSSYFAGLDWNNRLYGGKTNHLEEFICILLCCEYAIFQQFSKTKLKEQWNQQLTIRFNDKIYLSENKHIELKSILQEAYELNVQQRLAKKFKKKNHLVAGKPEIQAVFCIDVRSEVYRRQLENESNKIQTLGYAGFFGIPLKYQPLGHEEGINNCPVLLPSNHIIKEISKKKSDKKIIQARTFKHQFEQIFNSFKRGPLVSFGFVSPLGLLFLPRLLGDSFSLSRPVSKADQTGYSTEALTVRSIDCSAIPFETQLEYARSNIKNIGFNGTYAPIILLVGHGSTTVNNPHAAGLQCGACGGHSGDINALTLSTILNDLKIRKALESFGLKIPENTCFLAALHNTTTDELTILNSEILPNKQSLIQVRSHLQNASNKCRIERLARLENPSKDTEGAILSRSKDWGQVRPEWGLTRCNAFVIASRTKTKHIDFEGRAFLHDYSFEHDEELKLLEAIMTAPMVVTSWINLQYYASRVDNSIFGAGNKTLHNVTAGVGVIEGGSGDLRTGLPLQSIHNGEKFIHEAERLNVIIDAPIEAINQILEKHSSIKNLFDNKWINLINLDSEGRLSNRYTTNLNWKGL